MESPLTRIIEYSRKKTYYLKNTEALAADLVASADVSNPRCADLMQLLLLRENSGRLLLKHRGSYCALAHASAELACESFARSELDNFFTILHHVYSNINNESDTAHGRYNGDDGSYVDIVREMLSKKMSPARLHCFILPWNAVRQLSEEMEKANV